MPFSYCLHFCYWAVLFLSLPFVYTLKPLDSSLSTSNNSSTIYVDELSKMMRMIRKIRKARKFLTSENKTFKQKKLALLFLVYVIVNFRLRLANKKYINI